MQYTPIPKYSVHDFNYKQLLVMLLFDLLSTTSFHKSLNTAKVLVSTDHEPAIFTNHIYDGIDWMYTFSETLLAFEYRVWFLAFLTTYFDESYDIAFKLYWVLCIDSAGAQIVYSAIFDLFTNLIDIDSATQRRWVYNMYFSRETTLFYIHHPELIAAVDQINFKYYQYYCDVLTSVIGLVITNELFMSAVMTLIDLILVVYFLVLGTMFYFSYYSSASKEEALIDSDYALWNITIEAEEEISSMDDMLLAFIIIFYVFGWFFYAHCWIVISQFPELMFVLYVFPFLYYIILLIPTCLVFDFGIYFLGYLKGVGSSPVMLLELVYDYISFAAFYIRVLVQAVRLLLMSFTYASLHDFIIFYSLDQRWLTGSESIWDDLNTLTATDGTFSYFAIFCIIAKIYYWIYELLHTFFVVTAQATAYFAMVFWLFFFLFSFFVSEKQEFYFFEKRKKKK